MVKLLYCFDNKYDIQAQVSIYSVLENAKQQVEIYIIHKTQFDSKFIDEKILNHKNLKNINIKKFNILNAVFPKIKNSHVSEATYYRIYFDEIFKNKLDYILYLDSDIVFLGDISKIYNNFKKSLMNSRFTIAATKELDLKQTHQELKKVLGMKSDSYFNAGVLLIDVNKWKMGNTTKLLLSNQEKLHENLKYWDQDLFNSCFDGDYLELPKEVNFSSEVIDSNQNRDLKNIIGVHFSGKTKPWTINGMNVESSEIFQKQFRELKDEKYFIESRSKIKGLKEIAIQLFTLKFLRLQYPYRFMGISIKSIIKK